MIMASSQLDEMRNRRWYHIIDADSKLEMMTMAIIIDISLLRPKPAVMSGFDPSMVMFL
jgi:hypothetical protein